MVSIPYFFAMKFTKVTEKDIPLIQALAKKSWESSYAEILSHAQIVYMLGTMYAEQELSSQIKNPNYHYYLIENENDTYGFIGFEINYQVKTTKLHRLYLIPEGKGNGYGKESIDFLKLNCLAYQNTKIILNVNKQNPAKKFYKKQGFLIVDEGVFDIGEGFVMDDYIMEFKFE